MLYYLKGKIRGKTQQKCLLGLEMGATEIVLEILVPTTTLEQLGEVNSVQGLFVVPIWTDKTQALYGFATEEDRNLFETLVKLPNIGPSLAFRLLSGLRASEILQAVETQDVNLLAQVKGVGRKRAERLSFELGSRLPEIREKRFTGREETLRRAVLALVRLGLRETEAREAVREALRSWEGETEPTEEDLIREVLQRQTETA